MFGGLLSINDRFCPFIHSEIILNLLALQRLQLKRFSMTQKFKELVVLYG